MTIVIDIRSGDVVDQLQQAVTERGIRNAGMTLVGGVDAFTISTMPANNALHDEVTVYDQPGELTGTGEVVDGRVHVHVVCGLKATWRKRAICTLQPWPRSSCGPTSTRSPDSRREH